MAIAFGVQNKWKDTDNKYMHKDTFQGQLVLEAIQLVLYFARSNQIAPIDMLLAGQLKICLATR